MPKLLYIIWAIVPLFFFVMSLWAKLEQAQKDGKKQNPGDFFRTGTFSLIVVGAAIVIDRFMLEGIVNAISPDWLPLGFYQGILLPVLFLIGAKIAGPSKEITISNAPNLTRKRRR